MGGGNSSFAPQAPATGRSASSNTAAFRTDRGGGGSSGGRGSTTYNESYDNDQGYSDPAPTDNGNNSYVMLPEVYW